MAVKNIEMQKKNADGTFDIYHPKTKASMVIANNGSNLESHLAESATQAHLAKNIGLEDATGNFVSTELEGAMSELFTNVSSGKSLVGGAITGVDDSVVIPADPTFQDLASVIGVISTGKKWASGTNIVTNEKIVLGFQPSVVIISLTTNPDTITGYTVLLVDVNINGIDRGLFTQINNTSNSIYTTQLNSYITNHSDGFTYTLSAVAYNSSWIAIE